jgi:hypothetical protein
LSFFASTKGGRTRTDTKRTATDHEHATCSLDTLLLAFEPRDAFRLRSAVCGRWRAPQVQRAREVGAEGINRVVEQQDGGVNAVLREGARKRDVVRAEREDLGVEEDMALRVALGLGEVEDVVAGNDCSSDKEETVGVDPGNSQALCSWPGSTARRGRT